MQFLWFGLGASVVWAATTLFQHQGAELEKKSERARKLADSAMQIQVLADALRRPCLLPNDGECAKRLEDLIKDFDAATYTFKEGSKLLLADVPSVSFATANHGRAGREAKRAASSTAPEANAPRCPGDRRIGRAVSFIDDFYNPDSLPTDVAAPAPVQVALLQARPLLSRRFMPGEWCSIEGRAVVRHLMASLDTYRYCYGVVRRIAAEYAEHPFLMSHDYLRHVVGYAPKLDAGDEARFTDCACDEPFVDKVRRIAAKTDDLSANTSGPWSYDSYCPVSVYGSELPPIVEQLIAVTARDWESTSGQATWYERRGGGEWRPVGSALVRLGARGLAWGRGVHPRPIGEVRAGANDGERAIPASFKREGDLKAPAGIFELGTVFGTATVNTKMPFRLSTSRSICEDRPDQPKYNQLVEDAEAAASCRSQSCSPEVMRRADGLYDLGIVVRHNALNPVGGSGSCIFIHVERPDASPTAGCTAMSKLDLQRLVGWLDPSRTPLLVQLPERVYADLAPAWGLPTREPIAASR